MQTEAALAASSGVEIFLQAPRFVVCLNQMISTKMNGSMLLLMGQNGRPTDARPSIMGRSPALMKWSRATIGESSFLIIQKSCSVLKWRVGGSERQPKA